MSGASAFSLTNRCKLITKLFCAACQFSKDEDTLVNASMDVVFLCSKGRTNLAKSPKSTGSARILANYECPNSRCNVRIRAIEPYQVSEPSKYLIVQVLRVGKKLEKDTYKRTIGNGKGIQSRQRTYKKIRFEGARFSEDIVNCQPDGRKSAGRGCQV